MHKLTLDCDRLSVESFPTSAEVTDGVGTVHAREWIATLKVVCDVTTLKTNPTCCPCTP
jgi:hypothetical protein